VQCNDDFIAQLIMSLVIYLYSGLFSVRLTVDDLVNNVELLEMCYDFVIDFHLYMCK